MRLRALAMVGLLAGVGLAAECGPTAKPATPGVSLTSVIESEMLAQEAFAWAANRPLRWADFQATAPRSGDASALTAYSVFYGVRCTGSDFEFLAVAGFLPKSSWVKPVVLTGPPTAGDHALRHEQTHFDLTEVYTRRLRKQFVDLYEPCRRPDSLDPLVQQLLRQEKAEQARYDEETRHGLASGQQDAWNRRVAEDLTSLAKYVR
jgi:hypothetical protein